MVDASVVDTDVIVEDVETVVVVANIVVASLLLWCQTELWLMHQLLTLMLYLRMFEG